MEGLCYKIEKYNLEIWKRITKINQFCIITEFKTWNLELYYQPLADLASYANFDNSLVVLDSLRKYLLSTHKKRLGKHFSKIWIFKFFSKFLAKLNVSKPQVIKNLQTAFCYIPMYIFRKINFVFVKLISIVCILIFFY